MKWLSLMLALAGQTYAGLRFGCSTVSIQRLDPLVEPGSVPSAHVHQIVGGNAFGANLEGDLSQKATCTTCTFSENFSNYWTAVMYFKSPQNGTYKRVPIIQNTALPVGINGGMTVYYTQHDFFSNGNIKMTPFKPGFRMTVGNPTHTSLSDQKGNPGLKYVCLNDLNTRFPELSTFPTQKCRAGIMTVHHFPGCWDGKNLDSPDHQSHVYNTGRGAFQPPGACPSSHPYRIPTISLETMWDTRQFDGLWSGNENPFVMSYDDSRGYGTHADYVFGWKGDALQRAMDSGCFFNACENGRPLQSQGVQAMNRCQAPRIVSENLDGWTRELPGAAARAAKRAAMAKAKA